MKALVTGASSGIGREIAKCLSNRGYELILVARNKEKLETLQKELKTKSKIIIMDLSSEQKAKELYVQTRRDDIDILVNNAGFGLCGNFVELELSRELEMIETNVKALHILTKAFLRDFVKKDKGYILNVASSAGFLPGGPLMATYYATKSYVLSLTNSIWYELKKNKSNVHISVLTPGPVDTNFNKVANVKFGVKAMKADVVAKYAVEEMFKHKREIIPGGRIKLTKFFKRLLSDKALLKTTYKIQRKKITK